MELWETTRAAVCQSLTFAGTNALHFRSNSFLLSIQPETLFELHTHREPTFSDLYLIRHKKFQFTEAGQVSARASRVVP